MNTLLYILAAIGATVSGHSCRAERWDGVCKYALSKNECGKLSSMHGQKWKGTGVWNAYHIPASRWEGKDYQCGGLKYKMDKCYIEFDWPCSNCGKACPTPKPSPSPTLSPTHSPLEAIEARMKRLECNENDAIWSQWYNKDDPGNTSDNERRENWSVEPCAGETPLAAQCETVKGVQWDHTGLTFHRPCTPQGLTCRHADQAEGQRCPDFRVRYQCPCIEQMGWDQYKASCSLATDSKEECEALGCKFLPKKQPEVRCQATEPNKSNILKWCDSIKDLKVCRSVGCSVRKVKPVNGAMEECSGKRCLEECFNLPENILPNELK